GPVVASGPHRGAFDAETGMVDGPGGDQVLDDPDHLLDGDREAQTLGAHIGDGDGGGDADEPGFGVDQCSARRAGGDWSVGLDESVEELAPADLEGSIQGADDPGGDGWPAFET